MAVHYRTKGIIIKKTDRGEDDQVLTIYAKDFGRLEILGKAIRKIKSKLRSGADIFYLSDVEFIQGKNQKTLTDAENIEKFKNIWTDFKKLTIAHKIAEILDELIRGQEPDEHIFSSIIEVFEKLNNLKLKTDPPRLKLIYYYFLWNLFSFLGYQPELFNCVVCQKKLIPYGLCFSAKEGGVICKSCAKQKKDNIKISSDVVKVLRLILKKDWQVLSKLKIEQPSQILLEDIAENYYFHLLNVQKS